MIEAAAPAETITQAFSWLVPPQARSARLFGAAADLRPDTQPPGRGDGDRKRSRQVIGRAAVPVAPDGELAAICRTFRPHRPRLDRGRAERRAAAPRPQGLPA